ncbi:MAG: energy-converting hydrogenase subunit [Thermoproteota archaeon]|nr:energy-converting hydrogenase subunit [Thermoproteota archaeon]
MYELILIDVFLAVISTVALIFTFLTIMQKDLVKAAIYSSIESASYLLVFFLLMSPDLAGAYVAIGIGIYPAVVFFLIKKTERYEDK